MSNIDEKLSKLIQIKSDIKDAIVDKGVVMPAGLPFDQYSTKIGEISSGGGSGVTATVSTDDIIELQAAKIPTSVSSNELKELIKADIVGSLTIDPITGTANGFGSGNYIQTQSLNINEDFEVYFQADGLSYRSTTVGLSFYDSLNSSPEFILGFSNAIPIAILGMAGSGGFKEQKNFSSNSYKYYKYDLKLSQRTVSLYGSNDNSEWSIIGTQTFSNELPTHFNSMRVGRSYTAQLSYYLNNINLDFIRLTQNESTIYKLFDYPSEDNNNRTEINTGEAVGNEDAL